MAEYDPNAPDPDYGPIKYFSVATINDARIVKPVVDIVGSASYSYSNDKNTAYVKLQQWSTIPDEYTEITEQEYLDFINQ